MWKSGFCPWGATTFYPQGNVWKEEVFHSLCGGNLAGEKLTVFPQRNSPHSTALVENFWRAET